MATPHVAGVAARFLSRHPAATPEDVAEMLVLHSTTEAISDPRAGSPNALLYSAFITASNDMEPPSVALTSPVHDTTVSGTVTIAATADDNEGIALVRFDVNGSRIGTVTAAPFVTDWNTLGVENGQHVLNVRAFDIAGNSTEERITVTVHNPGLAGFDASLQAPACRTRGARCDTVALVTGRGPLGPESNAPNTLFGSCQDGRSGSFHSDESVDRIRVYTNDGGDLFRWSGSAMACNPGGWNDHDDLVFRVDSP